MTKKNIEISENKKVGAGNTTIAVSQDTRKRLNDCRDKGQSYESFINELVDFWMRYRIGSSLCGPGKTVWQEH